MKSKSIGFIILASVCFRFACKKDKPKINTDDTKSWDATYLYGVWVKGTKFGDTLWFMNKNGLSILRKPESLNPLVVVYSEQEFHLVNDSLGVTFFTCYTKLLPHKQF